MEKFELGQKVCIRGRGTANSVHVHARITRETETLWVAGYLFRGRKMERRYRKDYPEREFGASEYGGSSLRGKCQA